MFFPIDSNGRGRFGRGCALVLRQGWRRGACEGGQSTVEAAFALPILMLLVLFLLQPGILLYDRIVMNNAASEGCRVLMTSGENFSAENVEDFIRRRLSSVPQVDIFHVHAGDNGCSWEIETSGDETSEEVCVSISTKVRLLPLIGNAFDLLGGSESGGNMRLSVECKMKAQPDWLSGTELGYQPNKWAGAWL